MRIEAESRILACASTTSESVHARPSRIRNSVAMSTISMSTPGQPPRDIVIWNPRSGKRRGAKRIAELRQALSDRADFWTTEGPRHAVELARRAVEQGARRIFAAGGDGTVHEVANGLIATGATDVELVLAPIGSANDYAFSIARELQESGLPPETPLSVDVGEVRGGDGRTMYFIDALGLGLNGRVTVEAQRIAWLQGLLLYGLATVRALAKMKKSPIMSVQWNGGIPVVGPTLLLSVLIGRREGNFPLAPRAKLGDGWFDFVHAAVESRWEALRLLPRVALFGPPANHPRVNLGLCQSVRVMTPEPLTVHTDGEIFCRDSDGVTELDIQLLPRRLTVRLWNSRGGR